MKTRRRFSAEFKAKVALEATRLDHLRWWTCRAILQSVDMRSIVTTICT